MKAKKSFCQHFLVNENIAKNIAYALEREENIDNVLEIGPGKGELTKYFIKNLSI